MPSLCRYMRICGLAAEVLRSERLIHETFPIKELQDYWTSRPKFEECNKEDKDNVPSGPVDESGATQLYQDWLASQNEVKEEVPPPPYSLVDEEGQASEEQAIAATVNLPQASGGPSPASSHVTSLPPPTAPTSPASLTSNLHMAQASSQSPVTIDPVTSLTDEFGRQMISEAPDPSPVSQTSRPPSHPARANAYLQMPEPSRPLSYTSRPTSTQPQPGTGISLPSIASVPISAEPQSSGPWSQTPSTPSDLPLQEALYSAYSGQIKDHQHQPLGPSSPLEFFSKPHFHQGHPRPGHIAHRISQRLQAVRHIISPSQAPVNPIDLPHLCHRQVAFHSIFLPRRICTPLRLYGIIPLRAVRSLFSH